MSSDGDSSFAGFDADGFEAIAEEFMRLVREGNAPSIAEFAQRYPDRAAEIQEFLPLVARVEGLKEEPADTSAGISLDLPDRIGEYRIYAEIGRGGMGIVYEAEQEALGRRVALKVLPQPLARSGASRERFQREARAAAALHHTNIVPVFDVGGDDLHDFYAMQLIYGHGLDQIIEHLRSMGPGVRAGSTPGAGADGTRPQGRSAVVAEALASGSFASPSVPGVDEPTKREPSELGQSPAASSETTSLSESTWATSGAGSRSYFQRIARIGSQVADALGYAHSRGIVHRDVKPSNLLLDLSGDVWVTDFGLAKTEEPDLTQTGEVVGTLRYMAPERFAGECSTAADVYALGVTLYEFVTLRPAFEASNRLELIEAIRSREPLAPRSLDSSIPNDLDTIIATAMAKDPRHRYSSAAALAHDLECFIEDRPIRARRVSATERVLRWSRRNRSLAGTLVLVFLLLVTLTTVFGVGQSRERRQRVNLQRELYLAEMKLAGSASDAIVGMHEVERLARQWQPDATNSDYLGWEWFHFDALASQRRIDVSLGLAPARHGCVEWLPSGNIVAADGQGALHVIEATSSQVQQVVREHTDIVVAIETSPDQRSLVTLSRLGDLLIHDVRTLDVKHRFKICADGENAREFDWHPSSTTLAVSIPGHGTKFYDLVGGELRHQWTIPGLSGSPAFSPDGRFVAVLGGTDKKAKREPIDDRVSIWDLESRSRAVIGRSGEGGVTQGLCYSPDGQWLVWGSLNGAFLWNWQKDEVAHHLVPEGRHATENMSLGRPAWTSDGRYFVTQGRDGVIRFWDPDTRSEVRHFFATEDDMSFLAVHPERNRVAVITRDFRVRVFDEDLPPPAWEVATGVSFPSNWKTFFQWGNDSRTLAWERHGILIDTVERTFRERGAFQPRAWDGDQQFWTDTERRDREGNVLATRSEPAGQLFAVRRGPAGQLYVYNRAGELWLVDETTLAGARRVFDDLPTLPNVVVSSPDGEALAIGTYTRLHIIWPNSDAVRHQIPIFPPIRGLAFDGSGTLLAVMTERPEVRILDAWTGVELIELVGHDYEPLFAAFHPDGSRVATAGRDKTVRLWDPSTGDLVTVFDEGLPVFGLAWSPDGTKLASLLDGGVIRVREAPSYRSP